MNVIYMQNNHESLLNWEANMKGCLYADMEHLCTL